MKYVALSIALAFLTSCGNNTTTPQAGTAESIAPVNTSKVPATYLEGIYATSSTPDANLQNLFDGDSNTRWQTRRGAGPDEGVMLYFQKPTVLSGVEVKSSAGDLSTGQGAMLEVFANGASAGKVSPNSKLNLNNKPVKSLFIRILNTGKEEMTVVNGIKVGSFPSAESVSVDEIAAYDEKGAPLRIVAPVVVKGTATASSTLKPETAYNAANLFDGRKEFCWVEGNPATSGEGETLKFTFDSQRTDISAIEIWNGYQRSDEHFQANARAREIEVSGTNAAPQTYTLQDTKEPQKIELRNPISGGGECTITIKSVYPGKQYKDLAISEIVFFQHDVPTILQTPLSDKFQTELRAKCAPSPVARLLDCRIANENDQEEATTTTQSLILRSDGTFVFYSHSTDPNDPTPNAFNQESFADGNWELVRADSKSASIKIFGKWTDVSNIADYYKGPATEKITRIFNDMLTIEANKLSGAKMIGTFYYK